MRANGTNVGRLFATALLSTSLATIAHPATPPAASVAGLKLGRTLTIAFDAKEWKQFDSRWLFKTPVSIFEAKGNPEIRAFLATEVMPFDAKDTGELAAKTRRLCAAPTTLKSGILACKFDLSKAAQGSVQLVFLSEFLPGAKSRAYYYHAITIEYPKAKQAEADRSLEKLLESIRPKPGVSRSAG